MCILRERCIHVCFLERDAGDKVILGENFQHAYIFVDENCKRPNASFEIPKPPTDESKALIYRCHGFSSTKTVPIERCFKISTPPIEGLLPII